MVCGSALLTLGTMEVDARYLEGMVCGPKAVCKAGRLELAERAVLETLLDVTSKVGKRTSSQIAHFVAFWINWERYAAL